MFGHKKVQKTSAFVKASARQAKKNQPKMDTETQRFLRLRSERCLVGLAFSRWQCHLAQDGGDSFFRRGFISYCAMRISYVVRGIRQRRINFLDADCAAKLTTNRHEFFRRGLHSKVWPQMNTDEHRFLATEVSASNVCSTNLSCKASFIESFVIVHKVECVALQSVLLHHRL